MDKPIYSSPDSLAENGIYLPLDLRFDAGEVEELLNACLAYGDFSTIMGLLHRRFVCVLKRNDSISKSLTKICTYCEAPFEKILRHYNLVELLTMTTIAKAPGQEFHADHIAGGGMEWLTVAVCLTDINKDCGAFEFIPGTHKILNNDPSNVYRKIIAQDLGDYANVDDAEALELSAGSVFCYNGKLLHRGTANNSEQQYRSILFFTFGPTWDEWARYAKEEEPEIFETVRWCTFNGSGKVHSDYASCTLGDFVEKAMKE